MISMHFYTFWSLKFRKSTNSELQKWQKTAVLELLDSPKLITRKICMTEKHKHEISTLWNSGWIPLHVTNTHRVEKWNHSHQKIFCEINSLATSLVNTLLSRKFLSKKCESKFSWFPHCVKCTSILYAWTDEMVLQHHDDVGEAVGHDEVDSWKAHCLRRSLYHLNLDENLLKSRLLELERIWFLREITFCLFRV